MKGERHALRDGRDGGVDWAHAIQSIEPERVKDSYLVTPFRRLLPVCRRSRIPETLRGVPRVPRPGSTKRDATRDMGRFFVLKRGAHWTHTGAILSPRHRRIAGQGTTARHSPRTTTDTRMTRVSGLRA